MISTEQTSQNDLNMRVTKQKLKKIHRIIRIYDRCNIQTKSISNNDSYIMPLEHF